MSHIVTVEIEIRDLEAVEAACRRLGLKEPVHGKATLFQTEVEGILVQLPEWHYPIVCDLAGGNIQYDNYKGRWGDEKYFDSFKQAYTVEKATLEARRQGYEAFEEPLEDGSIRLTINYGGAA